VENIVYAIYTIASKVPDITEGQEMNSRLRYLYTFAMKCQTRVKLGLKDLQKTPNKDQQTIEKIKKAENVQTVTQNIFTMTKELMKLAVARHFTKVVISWRTSSPQSTSSSPTSTTKGDKRPNSESSPPKPNKKQKSAQIQTDTTNSTSQASQVRQKITAPQVRKSPRTGQANKRAGGNGGNRNNGVRLAKIARNKNNEKNLYVPPPRRGT